MHLYGLTRVLWKDFQKWPLMDRSWCKKSSKRTQKGISFLYLAPVWATNWLFWHSLITIKPWITKIQQITFWIHSWLPQQAISTVSFLNNQLRLSRIVKHFFITIDMGFRYRTISIILFWLTFLNWQLIRQIIVAFSLWAL